MSKKKLSHSTAGLFQALGVIIYTSSIAGFFQVIEKISSGPEILTVAFMLSLLVFSAAVTGALVFGYPILLAINKRAIDALKVLVYTLLYFLGFLSIILVLVSFFE
jgi:hypothetical protein